jgi:Domain of unknown function (DUF1772)
MIHGLKFWQFLALLLAALTMGMSFSHLLQMHSKFQMPGPLWVTLQQTLYLAYGRIGGLIEIAAMLFAAILAYLIHADRRLFQLTCSAAILLAAALFLWIIFTYPVNSRTFSWSEGSLPQDWSRWRTQWEYSHAVRFVLQLVAFSLLSWAIVRSTVVNTAEQTQGGISVTVTEMIHAPRSIVQNLYCDYAHWNTLFPDTIRGVSLVRQEGDRTILDVDHIEGHVINILRTVSPNTIELEEFKRKYDATFWNTFLETPNGTRLTIVAHIRLKGFYRLFSPSIRGLVRQRVERNVLKPMKSTAERRYPNDNSSKSLLDPTLGGSGGSGLSMNND